MPAKLQSPPRLSGPGFHPQDPLFSSTDDLHNHSLPSPPYRSAPSTSNLNTATLEPYPPSPAYDSKINIMLDEQNEKHLGTNDEDPRPNETDVKPKPTVHYPDNVARGPAPSYHVHSDSMDVLSAPASATGTDEEDELEDYDWSGEDDLVDEEAKFEERMGVKTKPKGWGPKRIVTLLFSSLIGSTFLAGVLVTPAILIHFYWYKPDPTPQRLYIKQNIQAWLFWAAANLIISWYLAMIIDVIPVAARFAISVSWGHVSEFVKSRIELYDSIKDTIKPLLYAASGWASWIIIFGNIFDLYDANDPSQSHAKYTQRVSQAISFLFFLALVICAQRMLSHAIAFAFHRTAYQERVDSVREALAVIETLRNYRPKVPTPTSRSGRAGTRTPIFSGLGFTTPFSEKDHFNFLSGALQHHKHGHRNTGSHDDDGEDADGEGGEGTVVGGGSKKSTLRKGKEKRKSWLGGVSRQSTLDKVYTPESDGTPSRPMTPSALTSSPHSPHTYPPNANASPRPSVDGHGNGSADGDAALIQAAKVLGAAVLHDARNIKGKGEGLGSMAWNVNSAHEAKRLARSIYMRFKDRRRNYLLPSDFHAAFPTTSAAEAAFRVFDKDNNGDISRAEIKTTLLKVYKERRFLSRSMRDVGVALKTLDHILLFFALVILFFISLSVFGVQVGDSLTSVYTVGIAASFIFKNAASSAFDAIMFLFVTHPFDTGDRCFIDDEVLVVKKMGLFATVFTRGDGTETYYFNSQLFTKFITNVRRSGKMFENLTMQVAWRTPLEKLDALEKNLNEWLATEENRWYEPSTSITLQHIDFQRYLELTIGIAHNGNWQDWGLRNARKTAFHAAVQYYCRQLDIIGYESPLPVVYGDPNTQTYIPSTPLSPGYEEDPFPQPVSPGAATPDQRWDEPVNPSDMKAVLGFLPPLAARGPNLTRARKSKSKKAMMRGMGDG